MQATINRDGHLLIKRANKLKLQRCPKSTGLSREQNMLECGDWCPLFGEPQINNVRESVLISLCDKSITADCNTFIDERHGG